MAQALTSDRDDQSMAAVRAGSREAFRQIVEAHQARLLAFCLRFLGDESAARDATQEVFLTLWRERERYQERGKLRLYLLKVARLRCLAAAKKRRAQVGVARALSEEAGTANAAEPARASEAADLVRFALAALPPEQADLLILRHLEQLELDEIVDVTGLRPGTIKSRLSRALAALRKELADVGRA
jgi:RNA polymerase sigma-70 factor (ECF subfamily)